MEHERSTTTYVILGMLRLGCRTGYDIKQFVDKSTRFFWAASYGQIYPELKRLEDAGLIKGEPDPRGARRRRAYELTPAGGRALDEWLTAPDESQYELRDAALLKLFFAGALDPEHALAIVRSKREYHEQVLARLREIEPLASEEDDCPLLVLRYGIGLHEWIAEWCRETERQLAKQPARAGGR